VKRIEGIIDLHCHILPGLDDGAPSDAMSVAMARIAATEGIVTLLATPHTLDGVHDVDPGSARAAGARLQALLDRAGIPLRLQVAAEVHLHEDLPDLVRRDPGVTPDGAGRFVLLELPHQSAPPGLPDFLFRLQAAGTTPVIVHPERNLAVRDDPSLARTWVERGALLQVTAGSLTGAFGAAILACCEGLVRSGLVHFIATDAHSDTRRPPRVQAAGAAAAKIVGDDGARALLVDNPARVLGGAAPGTIEAPVGRRGFLAGWRRR
jgi:protein-tyrosine phosphatase